MQLKSWILLMVALGCGLVASIGITQVISKRAQEPVSMGETIPILVSKDTIPAWTPLTAQHVKLQPWPKDRVPEGALSQIESVEGRRTKTPIYPGEPILEKKLFDKSANEHGPTVMIPKGLRVVTVKVDQVTGGSGLILPGDRVDVAVVLRPDPMKGIREPITKTFLQDIKVFAVNDQFLLEGSSPEEKTIPAKTVSLLVSPEQAQMILLASEVGKIQLVMRSPLEEDQAQVKAVRLQDILEISEAADREKEKLVKSSNALPRLSADDQLLERFKQFLKAQGKSEPSKAGSADAAPKQSPEACCPSQPEQWTIRLVRAAQVEDLVLEKAEGGWAVARRSTYGPPSESSGSATPSGWTRGHAGGEKEAQSASGAVGSSILPGSAQGPSAGGNGPTSPQPAQAPNLPHPPGQATSEPARASSEVSENPPALPPSGEEETTNVFAPSLGENFARSTRT